MRVNTPYIFNLCNRNCSFPRKHIVKNRYLLRNVWEHLSVSSFPAISRNNLQGAAREA